MRKKEIFGEITRNQVSESIKNLSDSVLDFVKKTNSEIRYIAEENKFKVRMMI